MSVPTGSAQRVHTFSFLPPIMESCPCGPVMNVNSSQAQVGKQFQTEMLQIKIYITQDHISKIPWAVADLALK